MINLIHQHLIFQSKVGNIKMDHEPKKFFSKFLFELVSTIEMKVLINPQVELSDHNAWSGLVGLVTSHIAFHYWTIEKYLQLDIYSCKNFDSIYAIKFIAEFWDATEIKAIQIDRDFNNEYKIHHLKYCNILRI